MKDSSADYVYDEPEVCEMLRSMRDLGKDFCKYNSGKLSRIFCPMKLYLYNSDPKDRNALDEFMAFEFQINNTPISTTGFLSIFVLNNLVKMAWATGLVICLLYLLNYWTSKPTLLSTLSFSAIFFILYCKICCIFNLAVKLSLFYRLKTGEKSFAIMSKYYPWLILAMELLAMSLLTWKILDHCFRHFKLKYACTLPSRIPFFLASVASLILLANHLSSSNTSNIPDDISIGVYARSFTKLVSFITHCHMFNCLLTPIVVAIINKYLGPLKVKSVINTTSKYESVINTTSKYENIINTADDEGIDTVDKLASSSTNDKKESQVGINSENEQEYEFITTIPAKETKY